MLPGFLRPLLYATCVLLAPLVGLAQEPRLALTQYHHTAWTAKDGAPPDIYALAQTSDGFLWLGSSTGLFRFDGVHFEDFEPAASQPLPSRNISALLAVDDGLWIGYRFGGVSLLRRDTLQTFGTSDGLTEGSVWTLYRDSAGTIWAGTTRGLFRLEAGRWRRVGAEQGFPASWVQAVLEDRSGRLWVAAVDGVFRLDRGASRFVPMHQWTRSEVPYGFLQEAPGGAVWLSTGWDGLRQLAGPAGTLSQRLPWLKFGEVASFHFDPSGDVWFASPAGVRHAWLRALKGPPPPPGSQAMTRSSGLSGRDVHIAFGDREGNVWLGTSGGLDRFRRPKLVRVLLPRAGPFFALAAADSGRVWVGSNFRHLMRFGEGIEDYHEVPSKVDCIYRDPGGVIWVATGMRLWRSTGQGFAPLSLADHMLGTAIQAITKDRSGGIWVSVAGKSVYRLAGGQWTKLGAQPQLPPDPALVLTTDQDGRTWFGYTGGRVALLEGDSVRLFTSADGPQVGNVLSIQVRGPHVWIGGERGLALFAQDRFRSITGSGGVAFRGTTGIVETPEGELWLQGTIGITRIPVDEIRRVVHDPSHQVENERLDFNDGLDGVPELIRPHPTAISASDGRLWFATSTDLFWIDPHAIPRNPVPPRVMIRSLVADGRTYALGEHVTLPEHTQALQVDFTASSLSIPERVRFRYRLVGSDTGWKDAGPRREAFYTNLGPGSYQFQVTAANEDGVWNTRGTALDLVIPPSFTQSRGFLALWVTALAGLAYLLYVLRLRQVAAGLRARYQAALTERTRIAQELHDTLLQGFGGITMQLHAARHALPRDPDGAAHTLDRALGTADTALRDARDMIWDLRGAELEEQGLADALERAARSATTGMNVDFAFQCHGEPRRLPLGIETTALRVGREAILNALKHAAPRSIAVELDYKPRVLRLEVRDDGRSMAPGAVEAAAAAGHWGIAGMRQRARLAGGALDIASEPGQGTTVSLSLPLDSKAPTD